QSALVSRDLGEHVALVYDFSGFKKENLDTGLFKILIGMISESYPQLISVTAYFVNSWLFTGLWMIIKSIIDPMVAKSTFITKDVDQLQSFLDKDQILTDMGGQLDFEYKYVFPTKEENIRMFDTEGRMRAETELKTAVDAFFIATKKWAAGADVAGYMDPARVQAAAAFHTAALELDPYIRARFLIERVAK
ncbi:phosphatidylinositol transfer protein csr1, partial [Coemansia sp. RSA 2599]